jgi:hypothetical protein
MKDAAGMARHAPGGELACWRLELVVVWHEW